MTLSLLVSTIQCTCTMYSPERSKTERGREGSALALIAGAHTDIWLEREDLGTSLLLCPGKMFRQGN